MKVTELLMTLHKDMDALVQRTIARIRSEVGAYRDLSIEVHIADNKLNLRNLVSGLIRFSPPDERAIEHAKFMGRQRALARLPLESATEGYHVAYAAVWRELLELTEASDDSQAKEDLTGYVTPLWTWFHEMSSAFSTAYIEAERSLRATRSDMRAVVHEALRSDLLSEESSRKTLRTLGFDIDQPATVIVAPSMEPDQAYRVGDQLDTLPYPAELISVTPETVLLAQTDEPDPLINILLTHRQETRMGIGRTQPTMHTAAQSYGEARRALGCTTEHRRVAHFEEVWPVILVFESSTVLSELLEGGIATALDHPHLAETVAAFANKRFSLTSTARAEHLHPNTAKYRLDRWHDLTGWDVYTTEGLSNSLASLELAKRAQSITTSAQFE